VLGKSSHGNLKVSVPAIATGTDTVTGRAERWTKAPAARVPTALVAPAGDRVVAFSAPEPGVESRNVHGMRCVWTQTSLTESQARGGSAIAMGRLPVPARLAWGTALFAPNLSQIRS
jgi:hypothetical protein